LLKVYNQRSNPIDLEVLTEWVNIEQVQVEVQSLNVVDIQDSEDEIENETISKNDPAINCTFKDSESLQKAENEIREIVDRFNGSIKVKI